MFKGSIVALVTPFTAHGEIDCVALDRLVEFHLENNSDGLVVAGTTGESATLEGEEFSSVLRRVVRRAGGTIPVLAGTGSASTRAAIEKTRCAADLGADGVLVVTPYYNKPTQSGLHAHFNAVADASDVPVVLYNVPSRTAVDMLPATAAKLSMHERITGIKEAAPGAQRMMELRDLCGPDFQVLSGDDLTCLDSMRHGADGVVSVAANVIPGRMHELCAAAAQHDWAVAEQLNLQLKPVFDVLMIETNPIPVKWALFEMGLIDAGLRLPLTPLDETLREPVRRCLVEQGLIDG
ncbi:MAG: 4-hydroxy-tetrahydrodipicolinate synthase [Xanthomonadales bacterium]|nr:4-hydroxy-tetrahydrodipicolinate synthase [Gammaproteobacteria bacterium]MBT8054507.1 4-hydroxy-tetrahydrodipicolinate synthase [Gammaproteobacteria bacterium]NND56098.1 4-hydroxy-tetrahydrodipicolinate synthase [Xanthomonadales bacterium]NNK52607.1 4-hydroxy-tetrahydrodipicolinate synthase [Xanthomonadales bacterium]